MEPGFAFGADLVEDVVVALLFQLEGHARLLEQVLLDVGARDLPARPEVDADELTLCTSTTHPQLDYTRTQKYLRL